MKTITFTLVMLLLTLNGCLKYQYLTLKSDVKEIGNEFVIENDTLLLKYGFKGEGGPIHIYAFNKLDKPIFIDWTKSAIIRNDKSESYVTGQSTISGMVKGGSYSVGNNYSINSARLNGTISTDPGISFIPPKTFIETSHITIRNDFVDLAQSKVEKKEIATNSGMSSIAKSAYYDESNSPVKFRSFITLSVNDDLSHSFHFDNRFWASEVTETLATPDEIIHKKGNQFYISEATDFVGVMTFIAVIGLIGLGAAAKAHK